MALKQKQIVGLSNGTLYASGWNDLFGFLSSGIVGVNSPIWQTIDGPSGTSSFYAYSFSIGDSINLQFHIPHDYKTNSTMYPHIHWFLGENAETTDVYVRWRMRYTYALGGYIGVSRTYSPSTIDKFVPSGTDNRQVDENVKDLVAYKHIISETATGISLSGLEPDSMLLIQLQRLGTALGADTSKRVYGVGVDLHYEINRLWTLNRNYPFD